MSIAVTALSICGFLLSVTGNYLVDMKRSAGFVVWTVGNAVWISVKFLSGVNWGRTAMFLVYAALNLYGWIVWKGGDSNDRQD